MVLAHTIVEAPNHGASSRAAAISAPSDAAPTTAAMTSMRRAGTRDTLGGSSACGASLGTTMQLSPAELADLDRQHLWHPFTQQQSWIEEDFPIIERADDTTLYDTEGNAYIDGVSSLWCNVHGHRHPAIDIAIKDQLDRVAHSTMLGLSHAPAARLAKELVELAPDGLTRVFFSDNGST